MSKMIVAYWNLRGRAEPIHVMLEYLGIDYERKVYSTDTILDPEGYKNHVWFQDKAKLEVDYPNIPYIVDGDKKLAQLMAVMKYLARREGKLLPKSETEIIRCESAEGAVFDIFISFAQMVYNPDFANLKGPFLEKLPTTLSPFDKLLGKRAWLAGDNLTYIDFQFTEVLDHLELCYPGCFDNLPNVKKYKNAFFALDKVAAYRKSDRFQKWPLYAPQATWGGKNEETSTGF